MVTLHRGQTCLMLDGYTLCRMDGKEAATGSVVHGHAFSGLDGNEVTTWWWLSCRWPYTIYLPSHCAVRTVYAMLLNKLPIIAVVILNHWSYNSAFVSE